MEGLFLDLGIKRMKKTDGSVSDKFGVQKFATNRPITKKWSSLAKDNYSS